MEHAEHVDAVERELADLVAAVGAGPLDAEVPTCPDWDVDALASHVGGLCGFWSHLLCDALGRDRMPFPAEPGDEGRTAWLAALAHDLVPLLRAAPADLEVWTWYPPDQTAGFWARRAAHEMAVHRVDAQAARRAVAPIDAALAIDGIDELLFLSSVDGPSGPRGPAGHGETLHLHATDVDDGEWLVVLDPEGLRSTREHAKGDLALRGAVSDLELVLYQRPTVGPVEHLGDDAALAAFHRAFTFA